jgi:hypothetical protein
MRAILQSAHFAIHAMSLILAPDFAAIASVRSWPEAPVRGGAAYGCCRWNTGRSVDAGRTVAPDPKRRFNTASPAVEGPPPSLVQWRTAVLRTVVGTHDPYRTLGPSIAGALSSIIGAIRFGINRRKFDARHFWQGCQVVNGTLTLLSRSWDACVAPPVPGLQRRFPLPQSCRRR